MLHELEEVAGWSPAKAFLHAPKAVEQCNLKLYIRKIIAPSVYVVLYSGKYIESPISGPEVGGEPLCSVSVD